MAHPNEAIFLKKIDFKNRSLRAVFYFYPDNNPENLSNLDLNGLHYSPRLYNTAIGRWNRPDPLADIPMQLDESPDGYAWGNPIAWSDPSGLSPGVGDGNDGWELEEVDGAMAAPVSSSGGGGGSSDFSFVEGGMQIGGGYFAPTPTIGETHAFNRSGGNSGSSGGSGSWF